MKRSKWQNTASHTSKFQPALVRMVPLNRLAPGVTVRAHVPFADLDGEKTRPAVVARVRGREIELLPITSTDRRHHLPGGFVEVTDLDSAGLRRSCAVRLRPVVVDRIELIEVLGELAEADLAKLPISIAA